MPHRPWPVPSRPWLLRQTWHQLAFLHWPVPRAALRSLVPAPLGIEEFDGTAWVGVIPFRISGHGPRGIPPLPAVSAFEELNVRTYVRLGDRPGVWFFSLDAASLLAVIGARVFYRLPYVSARMELQERDAGIGFRSERADGTAFRASYAPAGPPAPAVPGSLEHFLTERYCLYAGEEAALFRGEIHHAPWPLQPVDVRIERNDLLAVHGIPAGGPPAHCRYAERLEVRIWALERLRDH